MKNLSDLQLKLIISKGETTTKMVKEVIEYAEKEISDISAIVERAENEVLRREDEEFRKRMRVL